MAQLPLEKGADIMAETNGGETENGPLKRTGVAAAQERDTSASSEDSYFDPK